MYKEVLVRSEIGDNCFVSTSGDLLFIDEIFVSLATKTLVCRYYGEKYILPLYPCNSFFFTSNGFYFYSK